MPNVDSALVYFAKREVPLGRLVGADEDALFAAYLCSPAAACGMVDALSFGCVKNGGMSAEAGATNTVLRT